MKIATYLLVGFLILGLVSAAIKVLLIFALIALAVSFIVRPWETLGMVMTFVLLGLATRYPLPGIILISALCIAGAKSA